jgi:hypothetical protein
LEHFILYSIHSPDIALFYQQFLIFTQPDRARLKNYLKIRMKLTLIRIAENIRFVLNKQTRAINKL